MTIGKLIDGKAFAADLRAQVADGVKAFVAAQGRKPGLAVVLVGEDPASAVYVKSKGKMTVEVGMESFEYRRPASIEADELLELIEANVHRVKEVAAYAERMHLSTYQLNVIAKAGTGRTCSELITDQLILEAKRYLLATTDQVTRVADRLGYEDPSYFIRFFKKHTGHTPEGFRKISV